MSLNIYIRMKGMRAQRGKSLLIAGGVVALIAIAAIAAVFSCEEFHKSGEGGILPQSPYHVCLWCEG